ncbi:phosphoglycolate phosphatase-like HAD superfamily hydrolase [Actinokineospora baliensis]|uniref:haloacid dehalogenase-like hydrolase n=1 Tax=Actinokineospora baliensis TaxID=547056 RepID=UPI001956C2D2|nr:haloacid dehalogenase-like hydrolase [Actinokineospora baliensis]MBM7774205.1 phosphoglycolate phosphatase-like HAD superfamily hydrolase [Actinokineospora baliensis]
MATTRSTSSPPRFLVLWDVDHTLIETRGAGRRFFEQAFRAAAGRPLDSRANISGRTELDIIRESLRVNGIEPDARRVAAVAAALIREYEQGRDELAAAGRALPGAREALQALECDPEIFQTVLTGNLPEVAKVKLEVFDLAKYLHLSAGAYGADHEERAALVAVARERASSRFDSTSDSQATVIIGDTPGDVAAATATGARVIGVTTGKFDAAALRGADTIIRSLEEFHAELIRPTSR